MTLEELAEIRARADKATPGPWGREDLQVTTEQQEQIADCEWLADSDEEWAQFERDADFIAAAREDVPALLAEVERLRLRPDPSKVLDLIEAYRTSNLTDQGFADLIVSLYGGT